MGKSCIPQNYQQWGWVQGSHHFGQKQIHTFSILNFEISIPKSELKKHAKIKFSWIVNKNLLRTYELAV